MSKERSLVDMAYLNNPAAFRAMLVAQREFWHDSRNRDGSECYWVLIAAPGTQAY